MRIILITVFRFIFFGVIFAVAAFLSVHILAVFGVFLAIGLVIWWFAFPRNKICFMCLFTKDSKECKYCKSKKYFVSMLIGFLIVLVMSLVSVGVVYLESQVLLKLGFPGSPKTVSFVIPAKSQHRIGEIFPMKIELTGIETPVNAVQADIGFDPTQVSVYDVSTKDSFASIFIQKEINNDGGWVRLTGGLPNPGYFSDHGLFGTIYFQAKTPGLTEIKFLNSSMVLANDGRGSNVLKDFPVTTYLVIPDKLSSAEIDSQQRDLMTTIAPSPVLGARAGISGGSGVQLSFIESAPKIPVNKDGTSVSSDKVLAARNPNESDKPTGFVGQFLNYIQRLDTVLLQFFRLR